MCGISGVVSNLTEIQLDIEIQRMNSLIAHRGPDGSGSYIYKNVGLGHRRLSILDLSENGSQPMHWKERYTLIFNGEIYNYLEIREELFKQGYSFQSDSDTEVILAAYDFWKEDCLSRFNGMWSFALLDKSSDILFCSRDRFGIKPFYYSFTENTFRFGSEIKQLIEKQPSVETSVALDYLILGLEEATDDTFFKGIKKLTPGHYMKFDLSTMNFEVQPFYHLQPSGQTSLTGADYMTLLKSSISLRLRSDVRVGTCLSGGLDSSTVAALANEEYSFDERFFAIHAKSEEQKTDESGYAQKVSNHLDLNLCVVEPGYLEFIGKMDEVIYVQEEPFGSPSIFMQYFVFEEARKQKCSVMLDGQGGDETLLGYERYYPALIYSLPLLKKPKALLQSKNNSRLSMTEVIKYLLYFGSYKRRLRIAKKRLDFVKARYLSTFESNTLRRISDSYRDILSLQKIELTSSQLPHLLKYEDKNSMRHSIEARLPFLDYRVVECALALDKKEKIDSGWTKLVLRQQLNGLLPEEILWRKNKLGFNAPEEFWLKQYKEEMIQTIITSKFIAEFIEIDKIDFQVLDKRVFWRIFNLAKWSQIYNVQVS